MSKNISPEDEHLLLISHLERNESNAIKDMFRSFLKERCDEYGCWDYWRFENEE